MLMIGGASRRSWWQRVVGSFFLAALLTASAASDSDGLIPPHASVVLLSGLPGDVENETAYRDQLQRWLEIAASINPAKVVVLCDSPEVVTLPSGSSKVEAEEKGAAAATTNGASPTHTTLLKNDRKSFQGLGALLAGSTNPVVVIAWGHGGKQGNTPVFHVRGPRITAADFKALADQLGTAESRWLLMFPGSGTFAGQIAGGHRQILSSECDTMFTSDPVGMSLLLKVAREKPALSFEAAGAELGKLTANWYQTRSLARTEEPTFWREKDQPLLLAAGAEPNSLASLEWGAEFDPTSKPPPETAVATTNLPAVWKQIKKVEAQKYPDADAVVLRRRSGFVLGSNPAVSSEQDEYVQILTVEGKRHADFDISYAPPHEDLNFLDCEVLQADGRLVRLDPEAIRDQSENSIGDYRTGQRKFFSLPGAGPGAILHVRYRTEWKTFPFPRVSLEIPVDQELPTVEATVEATVPKDLPFHFALDGVSAGDPVIKQSEYGKTYRWLFENLPARDREILVAPRMRAQGVQISTFQDWAAFAEWYGRISRLTDEVTPEIAAKARELTRDAKTDREKVLALYNYVTRLRYVAVPLGVNSYRPHSAASVFQNQFGDCKDKANLFNTLLHAVNIDAHLVLVPRFSQADEAVPGLSFNHAISQVKFGNDTLWVDTTDDVCRFGMLPPGDPGRKVLVIDGQSHALTQLPLPESREHQLIVRGEVDASQPTGGMPMKLAVHATGFPDYELRDTRRGTQGRGTSLALLGAKFQPVAGSFALEKQSASSVAAIDENFSWRAEGAWIGGSTSIGGERLLRAPFWLPKEWELALNRRHAGLFLNQGYPMTLDEEFEVSLPVRAQAVLPEMMENKVNPLRWKIEWAKISDGKLTARLRAELVRGEFSAEETPGVQKQLRELLEALAGNVHLTTPKQP